jgi:hypothetical protein
MLKDGRNRSTIMGLNPGMMDFGGVDSKVEQFDNKNARGDDKSDMMLMEYDSANNRYGKGR